MHGSQLTKKFLLCLLILSCLVVSCTNRTWTSVGLEYQPGRAAPSECIAVFGDLMKYIGKPEPNIANDAEAQGRFLTRSMRKALSDHVNQLGDSPDHHEAVSNQSFTRVWNQPSAYSMAGSRHYDNAGADNPNDNRAIIDVLYEWDQWSDGLTNQYPGEKQLLSFIFVFEDGLWKLDDIYVFDDEYTTADSLKQGFRNHR